MFFLENAYLEDVQPTNMGLEGLEGALIITNECDEMWYNLREKMMKLEHTAIVNEDAYLLQEGKASFMDNVKKIFEKMKKAVEELFRRFMDWVMRFVATDKKLVERLSSARGGKSVKIKGYKYDGLQAVGEVLLGSTTLADKITAKTDEEVSAESIYSALATELKVEGKVTSSSEFIKALNIKIQGAESKFEFDIDRDVVINVLKTAKDEIAKAKRAKSAVQAMLNNGVKGAAHAGKAINKAGEFEAYKAGEDKNKVREASRNQDRELNKEIKVMRETGKTLVQAYGAYIKGLQGQRSQARAAVPGLLSAKNASTQGQDTTDEVEVKSDKKETSINSESFVGILGQF